ncbi:MAG: electron transfer flavoprotein subunit alpha/FixB family protein [Firmicutes bacterium]|nr:electron transfer flavoprotein subunit alpha/FixB family protein [Bacillota bacterium]
MSRVADWSGVLVLAEDTGGPPTKAVGELVQAGRRAADLLGEELWAVVGGDPPEGFLQSLAGYGVRKVYVGPNSGMSPVRVPARLEEEACCEMLEHVLTRERPSVVLLPGTAFGRSVAPRVAARLNTGLVADVMSIDLDAAGYLRFTKPGLGDNMMATIVCPERRPQMATIRPGTFGGGRTMEPSPGHAQGAMEFEKAVLQIEPARPPKLKLVEILQRAQPGGPSLEEAVAVLVGGRGLGGPSGFDLLRRLAAMLGAGLGATRAAVEEGWADPGLQIGQTGRSVSPKLYVAFGVSGAVQHAVGMRGSQVIVAVNKDRRAPIFEMAHHGIVGDAREVLQALVEECSRPGS